LNSILEEALLGVFGIQGRHTEKMKLLSSEIKFFTASGDVGCAAGKMV